MSDRAELWLASGSPRRRQLLDSQGVEFQVMPPAVDDGSLTRGDVPPGYWAAALAYLKARCVAEKLQGRGRREVVVLGADTLCLVAGTVFGQPCDQQDARRMLRAMRDAEHCTMTGVCLIALRDATRCLLVDSAIVRIGHLSDEKIDRYLSSGHWRGKAGAYNLSERAEAGWPIECLGDPTTVMGLPMGRLMPLLAHWSLN